MTRRVTLPDTAPAGQPDGASMRRQTALLTEVLNSLVARVEALTIIVQIETDITRPPVRVGQVAVDSGDVYVATGLTPSDWTQVN
jgi:hypothetical protein